MMTFRIAACTTLLAALALTGCDQSASTDTQAGTEPAAQSAIPETMFTSAAPASAPTLVEAKAGAKQGDRVVFEARVGGRAEPFVENMAVFVVTDSSVLSCDQLEGDTCRTPWDYCCEAPDDLLRHMATVQVVGEDGTPLKQGLRDHHGLAPLKTVVITGTVAQLDEAGNFLVSAESIHVKGG